MVNGTMAHGKMDIGMMVHGKVASGNMADGGVVTGKEPAINRPILLRNKLVPRSHSSPFQKYSWKECS
jgi:hypothetical protein